MVGAGNEIIIEREYESFEAFAREHNSSCQDPEFMRLARSTQDMLVEGTARSELLELAPQMAG
jgi:hypothetical protein